MRSLIRLALVCGALFPAGACVADDVRVDVVVDFNSGAQKLVRPSPDKPAYYYPVTLGYQEVGQTDEYQKPPPPTEEVQRLIARALFEQGYRVMTRQAAPSLLFVLRWGVMTPVKRWDRGQFSSIQQNEIMRSDVGGGPGGAGGTVPDMGAIRYGILQDSRYALGDTDQLLSLVAGDTLHDRGVIVTDNRNTRFGDILELARHPRYYIIVSAYDFKDWMQHYEDWKQHRTPAASRRSRVLWEEHMSTETAGRSGFGDVLPSLVAAGAPLLGRETRVPRLVVQPPIPMGAVDVGLPVLKNTSVPASAAP